MVVRRTEIVFSMKLTPTREGESLRQYLVECTAAKERARQESMKRR